MDRLILAVALIVMCTSPVSHGLKCHEGFNMTFNGIPLYYWTERTCTQASKCIGQEMAVDTAVTGKVLRTAVRYGACMSSSYANYLDCENLFGKGSDFDPASLLDMIPGIETSITKSAEAFSQNIATSLKQLLSNGKGIESFVNGIFTFYENLGFNLAKAAPLKPSLVKWITALIDNDRDAVQTATSELINDFAQLDTKNDNFNSALRTFLGNLGIDSEKIRSADPIATALIERLPGLVRSIFPSNWKADMWYDVAFKLIGHVNPRDWTQSTKDMVATIKSSYEIPDDVAQYVNPILDALPDLASGSQINPAYAGNWSLELLKTFSQEDSSTKAFSDAFINFLAKMNVSPLKYEFKTTIEWVPGLFYKFFPGDKTVIGKVYMKMAEAFNSFDRSTILSSSAPETKLSTMIKNVATTITGNSQIFNTSEQSGAFANAFTVTFSKMFYDLLNVKEDYTSYIDTFATLIDDEMKKWPTINVGSMIGKLITHLGGINVPAELQPMLDTVQNILTSAMAQPFNGSKLVEAFKSVTAAYRSEYPDSPFPDLVDRFINIEYQILTVGMDYDNISATLAELNRLNLEMSYWNIDMQFAFIKAYNFSADQLYQMLIKAFPDYDLYIRAMKAMDPEDVKQLMKDIISYFSTRSPHSTQGFVDATKPAFQKITKSIHALMSEMRRSFAPNLCKFTSCAEDLCNGQRLISAAPEYTKTLGVISTTTPGHADAVSSSLLLIITTFWMTLAMFL